MRRDLFLTAAATLLLALSPAGAVPPPREGASVDCTAPQYASDRLTCAEPTLRAAADRVAALPQSTEVAPDGWWEDGDVWFRRRARCAFRDDHAACLAIAYADRRAVLQAAAAAAPGGVALACDGAWRRRDVSIDTWPPGPVSVLRTDGRLAGVVGHGGHGWQPFLSASVKGDRLRLTPLDGRHVTCRRTTVGQR